jgi:hypothetical protein
MGKGVKSAGNPHNPIVETVHAPSLACTVSTDDIYNPRLPSKNRNITLNIVKECKSPRRFFYHKIINFFQNRQIHPKNPIFSMKWEFFEISRKKITKKNLKCNPDCTLEIADFLV